MARRRGSKKSNMICVPCVKGRDGKKKCKSPRNKSPLYCFPAYGKAKRSRRRR